MDTFKKIIILLFILSTLSGCSFFKDKKTFSLGFFTTLASGIDIQLKFKNKNEVEYKEKDRESEGGEKYILNYETEENYYIFYNKLENYKIYAVGLLDNSTLYYIDLRDKNHQVQEDWDKKGIKEVYDKYESLNSISFKMKTSVFKIIVLIVGLIVLLSFVFKKKKE